MTRFLFRAMACMLLAVPATLQAQTREVSGRVLMAGSGAPLDNATVTVVGQAAGARTNERGEYRVRVAGGDVTLLARALGFKRLEQRVAAGSQTASFTLERDALQLEGVTITGAATTIDRRNAATAIVSVSSDELSRVPAPALESALQGKVVGAQISMNNGAPGGGGQVQIRGASSLLGRIDPLYVVDGVIISNAVRATGQGTITGSLNKGEENGTNRLADINPNDIENIEVLKGASASAIYGSQATNGVIVITTKRGRTGATRVNLSQRVGTSQLIRKKGSRMFTNVADALSNPYTQSEEGQAAVKAAFANGTPVYQDYQQQLFGQTAPTVETILGITGGSETTKFYLSGDDKQERGIARNTAARRQSLRFNLDQNLGSRLTAAIGGTIVRSFSQRAISNNDNSNSSPLYAFFTTPAIVNLDSRDSTGRRPYNPFSGGYKRASNPFDTYERLVNNEDVYRQIANLRVNYSLFTNNTNDVQLSLVSGADRFSNEGYQFGPPDLQFLQPGTNQGTFPGIAIQGNGTALLMNSTMSAVWTFTPASRLFSTTTSGGFQLEDEQGNDYTITGRGTVPGLGNASGDANTAVLQTRTAIRTRAQYVQEQILAFDDKLMLSGAIRGERSSLNGDVDKVFLFPRGQASYRFVDVIPFVSELKLRAALGESGNRPEYGARFVTLTNGGLIGGQTGLIQTDIVGNPDIRPERMHEAEYGLDMSVLNERVHFEGTYYDRRIKDLLVKAQLAQSSGVNQQNINGGTMQSKGVELGLTLLPLQSNTGLNWTSRTTWYQGQTKILSFIEGIRPFTTGTAAGGFGNAYGRLRYAPGYSVSTIWGNKTQADGSVTPDTPLGDANPQYTMGFSNDFRRGNWSLTTLVDYRRGGTVANMTLTSFDDGQNTWDYDRPSPDPKVGKTLGEWRYNSWHGGNETSVYLQDGSFTKVREVTLGYELSPRLVNKLSVVNAKSARVSLSGRNLFIISAYNGFDPEVNNGGSFVARFVDLAPFPPSRSFFLSVDLGF